MPIHCPLSLKPLSDTEFADVDRTVMACCFGSQNHLGRFYDERIYENDVAARLRAHGFSDVQTQVPVTLTHQSFTKTYRLDLLANRVIYELKTVQTFAPEHKTQAIQYAALRGLIASN